MRSEAEGCSVYQGVASEILCQASDYLWRPCCIEINVNTAQISEAFTIEEPPVDIVVMPVLRHEEQSPMLYTIAY